MIVSFDDKPRRVQPAAIKANTVLKTLDKTKEFKFYETGSRVFGTARDDSDWDFYVALGEEEDGNGKYPIVKWLNENKFKRNDKIEYYDVSNIYGVWENDTVDILVVLDCNMETAVQKAVIPHIEKYNKIPKDIRMVVWEVGYAL